MLIHAHFSVWFLVSAVELAVAHLNEIAQVEVFRVPIGKSLSCHVKLSSLLEPDLRPDELMMSLS